MIRHIAAASAVGLMLAFAGTASAQYYRVPPQQQYSDRYAAQGKYGYQGQYRQQQQPYGYQQQQYAGYSQPRYGHTQPDAYGYGGQERRRDRVNLNR